MPEYQVVDVFTDTPLEGNPLAVFTRAADIPAERLQRIAREMNLSETVFVLPPEQGGDHRIRIFTPFSELPFAGHPTLGTAYVLGPAGDADAVTLETGAGAVEVSFTRSGERITAGRMTQPIPTWRPYEQAEQVLAALGGVSPALPVEAYRNGPEHVYVALAHEDEVASLRPDLGALARLLDTGVYCFAGSGLRWRARMFAPGSGIPEDPATGSAAGPLAVHLARHGRIAPGDEIEIRQGVEMGRPSTLYARAVGQGDAFERVEVAGSAVVVARGELLVGR